MNILEELLSSRVRAEIFRLLFDGSAREMHVRAMERNATVSFAAIRQELQKLAQFGLVQPRRDGNRLYYSAQSSHPLYPEITGLVAKTLGYLALLQKALDDPAIELAFVFGSMAEGKEKPASDVDLAVIGATGMRGLTALLSGIEKQIGREINPHTYTAREFAQRSGEGDHFVAQLLAGAKIFVKGSENDLKRICG